VDSSVGKVTVTAGDGDEIVIAMHKTAWAATQEAAQEALDNLKVSITQDGDAVRVEYKQPNRVFIASQGIADTVDFTITVPRDVVMTVHTGSGDVALEGTRGDASLEADYGDIAISNLKGGLNAETSSGKVGAEDIQAGKMDIVLHSDYGKVTLDESAARKVKLSSSSGDLTLNDVNAAGEVSLDSNYGEILFEDGSAGSLTIEASSGRITLTDLEVSGSLTAHSNYGDVELMRVMAESYDLDTSSGAVTVERVSGSLKAHSGYGNVKVTRGEEVTLDLSSDSGSVEYSGSLGEGPHTMKSNYGNLQIELPRDVALDIELKTDYGKVKSALPVTLSGYLEETHWVGTINGGGASFAAVTKSGDVRLEILNP
jgi:DUF4097 and DUF4098 domain-containing protein YvlB